MTRRLFSLLITVCLLASALSLTVFAEEPQQTTISKGAATADGVISENEWDGVTPLPVDRAAAKDCKDSICTEGASSAVYRAMWDADYLYLLIELSDDQLVVNENSGTSYRNDCFFVYVGENVNSHADYSASTYMLCLFPYFEETDYDSFRENGKSGTMICRNGTHNVAKDSYKCSVTGDDENGYSVVMEAAIAWNNLDPTSGDSVAFDLQYNDANSALYGSTGINREAIWTWSAVGSDGRGPNSNMGSWGVLELADPDAPVPPPDTDEPTPPETNEGAQGTTEAPTTTTKTPATTTATPSDQTDGSADGDTDQDGGVLWIVLGGLCVLAIGAGVVVLVIQKNKQHRKTISIVIAVIAILLVAIILIQFLANPGKTAVTSTTAEWEGPDVITYTTEDESGYDLWLRYEKISSANYIKKAQHFMGYVVTPDTSREVIHSAYLELLRGLPGLYGIDSIPTAEKVDKAGALILGTVSDPTVAEIASANGLSVTEKDGYLIKKVSVDGNDATLILGESDSGVLYGTFKLLEILATEADISDLNLSDAPKIEWRVLNQWDNWDGSIERGYSGKSIYDWTTLPKMPDTRIEDFARANASVGINTIVINNVNSSTNYIDTRYLNKVAAVAEVFGRYGIRLGISVSFDAPSRLGKLSTNDPLNKDVIRWWEEKTAEIYEAIPNFAGYLIKADSEGRDGPSKYGRTHAEGANMFADVLEPYGGIIMWRAFVYGEAASKLSDDICNQAYEFFKPMDGEFKDNVILQSKNGPRDFLPREPVSPLFGGMKDTNMGAELQITQEYTGQNTDLCYLVSQWKYYLDFDLLLDDGAAGVPTTLSQILQGNVYEQAHTLVAGVSNVGDCEAWNDGLLSQANWYGFGRLAWDPDLTVEEITETWVKMTFNTNEDVVNTVSDILYGSWEIYEAYTSPYSMGMTVKVDGHYDPDLAYRNGNGTISVDRFGVGNNRNSTAKGNHTDATAQYSPRLAALLNDINTCPEELICWFHHVSPKRVMSNGQTLISNIYEGLVGALQAVKEMKAAMESLEGKIDGQRLAIILRDFDEQYVHSVLWSETMIKFFEEQTRVECTVKG